MGACAGASANVALVGGGGSALVFNSASETASIRFGTDATVTANPATDIPISPGGTRLLSIGPLATWAATAIGASGTGTGTVYFMRGEGSTY
jgi:hypothetical protein